MKDFHREFGMRQKETQSQQSRKGRCIYPAHLKSESLQFIRSGKSIVAKTQLLYVNGDVRAASFPPCTYKRAQSARLHWTGDVPSKKDCRQEYCRQKRNNRAEPGSGKKVKEITQLAQKKGT